MTDKQIIIDGVDVSGCLYFCDGYCNDHNDGFKCNLNSEHCYYKQLKAKEQECEELKKIIDEAKNSKLDLKSFLVGEAVQNEYEQQLDQLKAECEELKTGIKQIQKQFGIEILYCKVTGESTFRSTEILKLKQTLTEINEIAEKAYCLTNSTNKDMAQFAKQILQKISECEGNDE